jgi:small GTP-binding protein
MSARPPVADVQHKVVFLGDSNTGKTSIILKFLNLSAQTTPTVGATSHLIPVRLPKTVVTLNCWDTAGQENYRCLVPIYARGAEVACVVFDQANQTSFQSLERWLDYIETEIGIKNIMIVANKMDLEPVVPFNKAVEFCTDRKLQIIATSALSGNNVKLLFTKIAEMTCGSDGFQSGLAPGLELADGPKQSSPCC